MKNLYNERTHVETTLNTRFNFFLFIFTSIIASILVIENVIQLKIVLWIGSLIEIMLALVIARSQRKLDLFLKKIYTDKEDATAEINALANKGSIFNPLRYSLRRVIGYIIPAAICIILLISSFFPSALFSAISKKEPSNKIQLLEEKVNTLENEVKTLKTLENKTIEIKSSQESSDQVYFGIVALIISVGSFIAMMYYNSKTQKFNIENSRMQQALFHLDRNDRFEGKLAEWKDAFKFYGIDLEIARKEDNISPEQIAYLVMSTNSLSSIAQAKGQEVSEALENNLYRKKMFDNLVTRKAWKYAQKCFSNDTVRDINNYISKNYQD